MNADEVLAFCKILAFYKMIMFNNAIKIINQAELLYFSIETHISTLQKY